MIGDDRAEFWGWPEEDRLVLFKEAFVMVAPDLNSPVLFDSKGDTGLLQSIFEAVSAACYLAGEKDISRNAELGLTAVLFFSFSSSGDMK